MLVCLKAALVHAPLKFDLCVFLQLNYLRWSDILKFLHVKDSFK